MAAEESPQCTNEAATAFRRVEKLFKLNRAPDKKNKKHKQAATPALDLSLVVDLGNAQQVAQLAAQGQLTEHLVPALPPPATSDLAAPITLHADTDGHHHDDPAPPPQNGAHATQTIPAFTFAAHPGLVVVPGAMDPATQLELAHASFTHYCEPPSRTNHDREHGPLTGLWEAARRGLVLRRRRQAEQQPSGPPTPPQGDTQVAAAAEEEEEGEDEHEEEAQGSSSYDHGSHSDEEPYHGGGPAGEGQQGSGELPPAPPFDALWEEAGPEENSGGGGDGGAKLRAQSLLRRMRWTVLGPTYDWTRRLYLPREAHRRLPAALRELGRHWAGVAVALNDGGAGGGAGGDDAPGRRPYQPDGALLNYYYEGDTLMGHCDDVEPDQTQPLVTLSLGCGAVFLMGGRSKDQAPTPLLLRSGDVVVLHGEARRCYHGVPRVLPSPSPPPPLARHLGELEQAGRRAEHERLAPFLQHLCACRINVSVRAVS